MGIDFFWPTIFGVLAALGFSLVLWVISGWVIAREDRKRKDQGDG